MRGKAYGFIDRLSAMGAQGKALLYESTFSQGFAPHPTKGLKTLWNL
jgi:hypothetical protein